MVAKSEIIDPTMEDYNATNCLMLLTKVGQCDGGGKSSVFRCKTCLKEFSSFQALGGHRASHKKPINNGEDKSSSPIKKAKLVTSHRCPICGIEFPMGQALGGHMRRHKNEKEKATLVTRSFLPEETSTVTTLKKSSSGKRVACLDLGFDHVESLINLKLELGRTID